MELSLRSPMKGDGLQKSPSHQHADPSKAIDLSHDWKQLHSLKPPERGKARGLPTKTNPNRLVDEGGNRATQSSQRGCVKPLQSGEGDSGK